MYYVWTTSNNYPNSYWLKYDWKNNPDYLQFIDNQEAMSIKEDEKIVLHLNQKVKIEKFLSYDYLLSDAVVLVSEKLACLMEQLASNDVKLVKAIILPSDQFIGNYYIPIILNTISCINKKESIYDKDLEDYTKLCFKKGSLKEHVIVKAKGYELGNSIVAKTFVEACIKEKIKGIDFVEEPYFNPLYN